MSYTDSGSIEERLAFSRITAETREELRRIFPIIERYLPEILERFYVHLFSYPVLKNMVGPLQERLSRAQLGHWKRLFSGAFDAEYFNETLKIGAAHQRIGLEPRWYVGGYQFVLNELHFIILDSSRWNRKTARSRIEAVNKALMLDLDLALSAYQSILLNEKKEMTEQTESAILGFQNIVFKVLDNVRENGTGLQVSADNLRDVVNDVSERSESAAVASRDTATSVTEIASATEELSKSIAEVSAQISGAASTVTTTVRLMAGAHTNIDELSAAAKQIGDIVTLIQGVASQTNLLALNATIEAARAGEAGKGFAVVASEVKDLASRTSSATEDIGRLVGAIQTATDRVVSVIQTLSTSMREVDEITSAIAAAARQQGAATEEISRSVTRVSGGAQSLSEIVGYVSGSMNDTRETSDIVTQASDSLREQTTILGNEIRKFFVLLREGPLDRRKGSELGDYRGPERRRRAA